MYLSDHVSAEFRATNTFQSPDIPDGQEGDTGEGDTDDDD